MATHDYVISNGTGAAVRADLNNALAAIVSNNSSSSEPATKYAYQWWADTNTGILKIRNSANNGWVELLQLDGTLTLENGSAAQPALAFRDDLDTGIFSENDNQFDITTGGGKRLTVDGSGRVGIGVQPVTEKLEISGAIRASSSSANFNAGPESCLIDFDLLGARVRVGHVNGSTSNNRSVAFIIANTEQGRFDASGRFLVGTSTAQNTLGLAANIQQFGGDASTASMALMRGDNSAQGAFLVFSKSRNAAVASRTIEVDGDELGNIFFVADDGQDLTSSGAAIKAHIDGPVGADDIPARLSFWTCNDGQSAATEKMRLTQDGLLLVGETVNGAGTHVVKGSLKIKTEAGETHRLYWIQGTGGYTLGNTGGAAIAGIATSEAGGVSQELAFETHRNGSFHGEVMRLTKAGRVCIGLSSQVVSKLFVSGGSFSVSGSDADFGSGGNRVFLDHDSNNVRFGSTGGGSASTRGIAFYTSNGGTGTDQRMLLDPSGDLMIGTTDEEPGRGDTNVGASIRSDGRIFSSVTGFSSFNRNSDGAVIVFARSGTDVGNIAVTASGTTYNPTSDYRLKENVVDITDGIEKVKKLKPYRYNFSTDPAKKVIDGFFAHEVSDIVAGAATGYKDEVVTQEGLDEGKYDNKKSVGDIVAQGLDYSRLTPILTAALQEAIAKIETLETKVAALESA